MIWSHPFAFIGLIIAPLIFGWIAWRSRKQYVAVLNAFSSEMQTRLFFPRSKLASGIKATCLLLACLAFIIFCAGPKSATLVKNPTTSLGRDVFILFDVSESMNAEDMEPNRLSIAKLHVEDLLEAALGDRIGLIAFAGSAQVEVPLTTDYSFFRSILRKIDTSTVQMSGTAIGDAIRLALERFGKNNNERSRAIVLITDGEDHESLPLEAARNAAEANVPVIVIAIGDLNGAKIPVVDASGHKSYKMFDGETIVTKPNVDELKEIARISKGRYYYANSKLDLAKVYKESIDALQRSQLTKEMDIQYKDLYQPFLASGLLLFFIYYYLPSRFPQKRRTNVTMMSVFIVFSLITSSYAICSAEEYNSLNTKTTSTNISSRQAVKEYNKAMKLFAENKTEEAKKIQETLVESNNTEVRSRVRYNNGVDSTKKILQLSTQLKQSYLTDNSTPPNKSDEQTAQTPQISNEDIVEKYEQERSNRDRIRHEINRELQISRQNFKQGGESKNLGVQSLKNAEQLASWNLRRQKEDKTQEANAKALALPTNELQLLWIKKQNQNSIQLLEELHSQKINASLYQHLFSAKTTLVDVNSQATELMNNISKQLRSENIDRQNNSNHTGIGAPTQTHHIATITDHGNQDLAGAQIIDEVQKRLESNTKSIIEKLTPNQLDQARKLFRKQQTDISLAQDVLTPYVGIVLPLATQEQKNETEKSTDKLSKYDSIEIEDYFWDRKELQNSVNEFVRKAEQIVKQGSLIERKNVDNSIDPENASTNDVVDLSDVFDDLSENKNKLDENNLSENSENNDDTLNPKSQNALSQEEKIFESAELALKYRSNLNQLITQTQELLGDEKKQPQKLESDIVKTLAEKQLEISKILQEIVRPLQDQQNQNQNSDQNSKQNKEDSSQNQNNEDKNQQDNKKDKESDQKQDSNDPKEKDKQTNKNDSQSNSSKQNEQQNNPQKKNSKISKEEQEAEALIRQVERRQKDAEEQRQFLRQLFKKREISGKDW